MKLLNYTFSVIILISVVFNIKVHGILNWQDPTDNSVCTYAVSRRMSRYVPYVETYTTKKWGVFRRIQSRMNYRITYSTYWVTESRCCNGYEKQDSLCVPICLSGCTNGKCVMPNVCECNPGYKKSTDPEKMEHICEPDCPFDCINGECSAPGICTCHPNYHSVADGNVCFPTCEQDCHENHATCTAPNTCTCNPGYANAEDSVECKPVCDIPCVNGECVAPDTCQCHDGYEVSPNNVFECLPRCTSNCTFGTCTAPDTCTCDKGYASENGSDCQPVCSEPCTMGVCIAPETCSCNDGYGLRETSKYICEPICEGDCTNGICTHPQVCTCNKGYWYNGIDNGCKPFCRIPCEPFGTCVAPDECSCIEGYQSMHTTRMENEVQHDKKVQFPTACIPVCKEPCINGICMKPDQCSCNPGYRASNDSSSVCEPICDEVCGRNSTCTAPNTCSCNPGYEHSNVTSGNGCKLICEHPCAENSICSAPNTCTCKGGFVKNSLDQCVPFCASPCHNATCVAPNTCKCLEGFTPQNDSVCVPLCKNGCDNGDCVAPNECRCQEGFVIDKANDTGCVSVCSRNCSGHGSCIHDKESCECTSGWTGWNCEQPSICIYTMDLNDVNMSSIAVQNETNSTIIELFGNVPHCHHCNDSITNETLCYTIKSNDTSSIGCLVSTELPCYMKHKLNTPSSASKIAGSLAALTILLIASTAVIMYISFRKYQRRKIHSETVIAQGALFQGSIATESLLSEDEVCMQ